MHAMVAEHYLGHSITNTTHLSSPVLLFMLLEKFASLAVTRPAEFLSGECVKRAIVLFILKTLQKTLSVSRTWRY